jgi:L-ascorbate metabolism protein UlaG (beta-lactamase superfamily)
MVITHHGAQCFKVTLGDLTVVFDPIAKGGTLPPVRFGADIALISRNHPNMNGAEEVTYGEKAPFVVTGPGEYERQGVVIQGFLSHSAYGLAKGQTEAVNTIYMVELEDMTLVHLGALSDKEFPKEARESIHEIDVLFVPIGGDGVLTPSAAHELVVSLEPKIIVPMHWSRSSRIGTSEGKMDTEGMQGIGQPKSLEAYLKESGSASEKVDKLTLKKKDLMGRDESILIVTP